MSDIDPNPMGREYTPKEWAAAKRVGLTPPADVKARRGVLIYATGNFYPDYARQMADDWKLVADALDREWERTATGDAPKEQGDE